MKKEIQINTCLGPVNATITEICDSLPVLYLHGVFLDKSLWDGITPEIPGHTAICIDMPNHGSNGPVGFDWSLADCVKMVAEVITGLGHKKVVGIGHSWGSMVLLRAVAHYPQLFAALGMMNMPVDPPRLQTLLTLKLIKSLSGFKRVFGRAIANRLYSKGYLKMHPEAVTSIQQNMLKRSNIEIQQVIDAVMIHADDGRPYLDRLRVPALAAIGVDDSVKKPGNLETHVLPGGHVSPHEAPLETIRFVREILKLTGSGISSRSGT